MTMITTDAAMYMDSIGLRPPQLYICMRNTAALARLCRLALALIINPNPHRIPVSGVSARVHC